MTDAVEVVTYKAYVHMDARGIMRVLEVESPCEKTGITPSMVQFKVARQCGVPTHQVAVVEKSRRPK